jgi:hypothetical protein
MIDSSDPAAHVAAVVTLYVGLPDAPLRASISDQWFGRRFHDDGVTLRTVETALLLGLLCPQPDLASRCSATLPDPLAGVFPTRNR